MDNLTEIMTKDLIVTSENSRLDEAYAIMVRNQIRHLPVVNSRGHVIGLLSERDIQRALRSDVAEMTSGRWESCEFPEESTVADYMTWPVKTVEEFTPIKTVVEKMLRERVSSYLVLRGKSIVGIVTTDDMLHALSQILDEQGTTWKQTLANVFSFEKAGAYAQQIADMGI